MIDHAISTVDNERSRATIGFIVTAVTACLLSGCGGIAVEGPLAESEQPSQCGQTWDGEPVEQLSGNLLVDAAFVQAHERPVVHIAFRDLATIDHDGDGEPDYPDPGGLSGLTVCTGTLVSSDLVLTAAHCLDDHDNLPIDPDTGELILPEETAINLEVWFNDQLDPNGTPRPIYEYFVTELVEFRGAGRDYALLRVEDSPASIWGTERISLADPVPGDTLAMIGHHFYEPEQVTTGTVLDLTTTRIRYDDLDTDNGGSGSGILHENTGTLAGIHTEGGCNDPDRMSNFGMRITTLLDASPTLRRLTYQSFAAYGRSEVRVNSGAETDKLASFGSTYVGAGAAVQEIWSQGPVWLGDRSEVSDHVTTAATITRQNNVQIEGAEAEGVPMAVPALTSSPVAFPPIASHVFLEPDRQANLPPGSYGYASIKSRSRLALYAGVYYFWTLNIEPDAIVFLDKSTGPIIIYVRDSMFMRGNWIDGIGDYGQTAVVYVGNSSVAVDRPFVGTLIAPNAEVVLNTQPRAYEGAFLANRLSIHQYARVEHVPFQYWEQLQLSP